MRLLYGSYAWLVLLAIVAPMLGVLAVMPGVEPCRRVARRAAQIYFLCIGSPVRRGGDPLPRDRRCVVVANHASYLDGMILTAALPADFTFVIKHEMNRVPLAGFLLRKLGSEFVDRGLPRHRRRVARRLLQFARAGRPLALFPEGTFDDAPGLRPFQLGAFAAAWRSRMPVVPIVISGSRRKLSAGSWLPSPGALSVHGCGTVHPEGYGSPDALMQACRDAMLEHLAEPDLGAATGKDLAAGLAGDL
jgi:1-acyl-sn-glycerol-3-phosphate acyltransferase